MKMDMFKVINEVADLIEERPTRYDFSEFRVPKSKRGKGCPLGWIAFVAKVPRATLYEEGVKPLGLPRWWDFYNRMHALAPQWQEKASACIKGLRAYAKLYHAPAPKRPARKKIARPRKKAA